MFESFDKILVSIMAKKVAFGSNHVVIDLPYGKYVKAHSEEDALLLKRKFEKLAARFKIKIRIRLHRTLEPAGRGIGPLLETKEALKVLEQTEDRAMDLEQRAVWLTAELLDLCLEDADENFKVNVKKQFGTIDQWIKYLLKSGLAHKKMLEIIKAQGGNPSVKSYLLIPADKFYNFTASKMCRIAQVNSKNITIIAKILGCPSDKKAGLYLHKKNNEIAYKHDSLFTLYSTSAHRLKEAMESLSGFPILDYD
jgi:AMP phosphorylase